ncbi:hypothetical protein BYT27DRAFT_7181683 [Phlegmacium glaucopus]|nr:hypothetical protein BYT27DRAFT_7181683 [Phlegmacium glaucopus]
MSTPLNDLEISVRKHALLCTIGFLIILPIGALLPRYTRTLPYKWFYGHWVIQLLIAGPIIFAGWALGHQTSTNLAQGHYQDPHQKMGLALIILYVLQIVIGAFVHFFKFPSIFRGHRAPQNYFHVLFGLSIFILAQYNVHYGLDTEWDLQTGGLHHVPQSAKNAWLALVVLFWVLYALGMAFIPRQFKQESESRRAAHASDDQIHMKP